MKSNGINEIDIIDNEIYINDIGLNHITGIDVNIEPNSLPEVTVSVIPTALNIDLLSKLELKPEISDIYDAIKCIRIYMQLDGELKKAVVASAKSAIDDVRNKNQADVVDDYALAKTIVERIFIGER